MRINKLELEQIVKSAAQQLEEKGIQPDIVMAAILAEYDAFCDQREKEGLELFKRLYNNPWYIESFQTVRKLDNAPTILFKYSMSDEVWEYINNIFNADLSGDNQGWENVYILLEKVDDERGRICSYGSAHFDSDGRRSAHFFHVEGDYQELSAALDIIAPQNSPVVDPTNLRNFVSAVFGWENKAWQHKNPKEEVDLLKHMKRLNVYSDEGGVQCYHVEE